MNPKLQKAIIRIIKDASIIAIEAGVQHVLSKPKKEGQKKKKAKKKAKKKSKTKIKKKPKKC